MLLFILSLIDSLTLAGTILQHPSAEQLQLTCIMKLVAALEGMKVSTYNVTANHVKLIICPLKL